jgi:hypothetical protein
LPRRKIDARTIGKTYATPDGKTFRPSMFLTLTCPATAGGAIDAHVQAERAKNGDGDATEEQAG